MRALICQHLSDGFSGVSVGEMDIPNPVPGSVLVRVEAAAANFPDLLMTQGGYQFKPDMPFVPGMEGAGVVEACGDGVQAFKPGDEVVFGCRHGAMAEYALVEQERLAAKPPSMGFAEAASYQVAYLTAYVGLFVRGNLQAGETLLVLGASGGVGMAAVDFGVQHGAQVIAIASTAEKQQALKQRGAHHSLLCSQADDLRDVVLQLAPAGADLVYDPVGGDWFDQACRCIAWNGRLLVIGFASGRIPSIPANIPLIKGFSIIGVRAGEYGRRNPEAGRKNAEQVYEWAAQGRCNIHICKKLPMNQALQSLVMLQQRQVIGKVVVMPWA